MSDKATVVKSRPRPRALIRCDDDRLADELMKQFPTAHRYDDLSEVEPLE